jgi:uncharacterized membrane protein YkoI
LIAFLALAVSPVLGGDAAPPAAVRAEGLPEGDAAPELPPPGRTERQGGSDAMRPPAPRPNPDLDLEGLERAREAARAAAPRPDGPNPRLERANPRLEGLERAREAARRADSSGGADCLSAKEARGAIVAKRAVTLLQASRTARDAWAGELIDYRLCTYDGLLAYELTLLNSDGRVARVRVEAGSGRLVGVR